MNLKKKVALFLRRVGLYNIVRKAIRPFQRLQNEHRAVRFYRHFIPEDGLCFDVGANRGMRTEVFLRLGAQVISIEPLDINVKVLRHKFGANPKVVVVPKGLASEEGQREIYFNEKATDVASMSEEWIEVAKSLERLKDPVYSWEKSKLTPVTTLDKLIEIYGTPCFCKIDVEGYEFQVLKGLAQPIRALSIEYTPGNIDRTIDCVDHLGKLGTYMYNYSPGESLDFSLENWVDSEGIKKVLHEFSPDTLPGDVYAVIRQ